MTTPKPYKTYGIWINDSYQRIRDYMQNYQVGFPTDAEKDLFLTRTPNYGIAALAHQYRVDAAGVKIFDIENEMGNAIFNDNPETGTEGQKFSIVNGRLSYGAVAEQAALQFGIYGTIIAPLLSLSKINDPKSLVTREFVESTGSGPTPLLEYVDYVVDKIAPDDVEGRTYYDQFEKKMKFISDNPNFINWVNGALTFRVTNETGVTIPAGKAVDVNNPNTAGTGYLAELADALDIANNNDKGWVIGITTEEIADGADGTVALFGTLVGEWSGYNHGKALYVGSNGDVTNTRPDYPAKSILIGSTINDFALGILVTDDNYDYEFDGCILEKHDTNILVDGVDVVMDISNLDYPSRNLPYQLGGSIYQLDTTNGTGVNGAKRLTLLSPANAEDAPIYQTIYLDNTGTPKTTAGYPPTPYAVVGVATVHHHSVVTTMGGAWMHRRLTSAKADRSRGRISWFTERFSIMPPVWDDGVTPTAAITEGTPDVLDLTVSSGAIYQTHRQDYFPALSVTSDGVYVGNRPANTNGGNKTYDKVTNLYDVLGYTTADLARQTNVRGHLTIIAQINKGASECRLIVNVPSELYSGNDTQAFLDYNGYSDRTVSKNEKQVSFLVAEIQYYISNSGDVSFIASDGTTTKDGSEIVTLLGVDIGQRGGGVGSAVAFIPNLLQVLAEGNDAGNVQIKNLADGDPSSQDAASVKQVEALLATKVSLSGDETVGGVKTFSDFTRTTKTADEIETEITTKPKTYVTGEYLSKYGNGWTELATGSINPGESLDYTTLKSVNDSGSSPNGPKCGGIFKVTVYASSNIVSEDVYAIEWDTWFATAEDAKRANAIRRLTHSGTGTTNVDIYIGKEATNNDIVFVFGSISDFYASGDSFKIETLSNNNLQAFNTPDNPSTYFPGNWDQYTYVGGELEYPTRTNGYLDTPTIEDGNFIRAKTTDLINDGDFTAKDDGGNDALVVDGATGLTTIKELQVDGGGVGDFLTSLKTIAGLAGQPYFESDFGYFIFKKKDSVGATRFYIMPDGNPTGTTSKYEMFNTDYEADDVNYEAFNIVLNNSTGEINIGPNRGGTGSRMKMVLGGDYLGSSLQSTAATIEFDTDDTILVKKEMHTDRTVTQQEETVNGEIFTSKDFVQSFTSHTAQKASPDLDTIVKGRFYVTSPTNAPAGASSTAFGFADTFGIGNVIKQYYYPYDSNEVWIRYRPNSSTWSAWAQL